MLDPGHEVGGPASEAGPDLAELVDAADVAALLLAVDGLAAARQWGRLTDLARRCREAVELGRQLWPVAMHVDYRLALEGPGAHAAAVLRPGAGRFALGPLTEVAASTHDWATLAAHLTDPVPAGAVATERVLRGEDLTAAGPAHLLAGVELPLRLQRWEPGYALPTYRDRSASFPAPDVTRPAGRPRALPAAQPLRGDDAGVRALRELVDVWVTQSAGRSQAVAVEGSAEEAVGALVPEASLARISPAEAVALLQWAGASGGAYGRRPGGAAGRFAAWWTAAALAGVAWPADTRRSHFAAELGAALDELHFYRWDVPAADPGWVLRLAVEDPLDGLAWALAASDRREDDDTPS